MKEVKLYGKVAAGRSALVDDNDYDLVNRYRWNCREIRTERRNSVPYAQTKITSSSEHGELKTSWLLMHILIMGHPYIDHVNHDGLDNRRENLRPATTAQNNYNQRPYARSSSRYKGVTWHKLAKKWQATIKIDGRCKYLGIFASEEDAALAYDMAALNAYGDRAYLNLLGDAA